MRTTFNLLCRHWVGMLRHIRVFTLKTITSGINMGVGSLAHSDQWRQANEIIVILIFLVNCIVKGGVGVVS